jgi:hypothetical protein
MNKDNFNIINPSNNLYDRIILAIQKEKESQKIRKVFIFFTLIFIFSLSFTTISVLSFIKALRYSGAIYIIETAVSDLSLFLSL